MRVLPVLPLLFGAAAPLAAHEDGADADVALLSEVVAVDRLDAGTTAGQSPVAVDGLAGRVVVDVASTVAVTVTIQTPTSGTVDAANVAGFGGTHDAFTVAGAVGVTHLGLLAQPGFHQVFELPPPEAGTYTVQYDAGPGLVQEAAVVVRATSDSALRGALVATSTHVVVGEDRLVLVAPFFEGAAPVPNLVLSADLASDQGETATVALTDDGLGDDAVAGDGLYTGGYAPLAPGSFVATLDATGTASDLTAFRRTLAAAFEAVAPAASLAGTFTDQAVDADTDGLTDLLRVSLDVGPPTAGEYVARLRLVTAGDVAISVAATVTLAATDTAVVVDVPADRLRAGGEDGPWTVEAAELVFVDPVLGPRPASRAENLGTTLAVPLASLDGPPIALTGAVADTALDVDGDGDFDQLAVSLGVQLQAPGPHRWSLELVAPDGTEIGFASNEADLATALASIDVVFDGTAIGQAAIDGPWELRDLLIAPYDPLDPADPGPPGAGVVVGSAGFTQPWLASQFAGFPAGGGGGGGGGCSCRAADASRVSWAPTAGLLLVLAALGALARREARRR